MSLLGSKGQLSSTAQIVSESASGPASLGHGSSQKRNPSPSASASETLHPQCPAAVLSGSIGHPSMSPHTPSSSASLNGSLGHLSTSPQTRSLSMSFSLSFGHASWQSSINP